MKHTFYLIFLLFTVTSCNNKEKFVFNKTESIHVDTIPIQNLISPVFMTLTDEILTVTSYHSGPMLHFYKTPTLKYLYSTGDKGQGPGEFQLFPMICQNTCSNKLYIWGYTPLSINGFVFHNDSLVLAESYTLKMYETFNQLHIIQDSIFIYSAIPSDFSIKKYDLKSNREVDEISFNLESHNQPFFSSNYGYVAANRSFIIYAYHYKKQIDIYDAVSMKLKKQIIDEYHYETPVFDDNDNNVQQYINIVAGNKYFYALYRGGSRKNSTVNSDVLEVFDYNGNPVSKYTFNICPQIFIIDENNHILYGYSSHFENHLLKCSLDPLR